MTTETSLDAQEFLGALLRTSVTAGQTGARAPAPPQLCIRLTGARLMPNPAARKVLTSRCCHRVKYGFARCDRVEDSTLEEADDRHIIKGNGDLPDNAEAEGGRGVDGHALCQARPVQIGNGSDSVESLTVPRSGAALI